MAAAYLRPERGRLVLLAGLVAVGIGLQLLNPQVVRYFIDATQGGPLPASGAPLPAGSGPLLVTAALAYLGIGLLGRAVSLATAYTGMNLSWAATNALRQDLAAHLLGLDMPFHKAHTPGELIERVDGDVAALGEFFSTMAVRVIGNALLVAAILVLLLREDVRAGVALSTYTALTVIVLAFIGRIGVRAWGGARQAWADLLGFLEERIGGTEDIRGIGAEAYVLDRLDRLLEQLTLKARRGWLANALGSASANFLFIAGYGLGLAAGAYLYLRGDVTIGAAFLIVTYIGMLSAPLDQIRQQAEILQRAAAGITRVAELFALQPQVRENPVDRSAHRSPPQPLGVAFEAVSFRYGESANERISESADERIGEYAVRNTQYEVSNTLVLRDLSIVLTAGRLLGVLGRTGSGKTTLTRLLFRLHDPSAGTIRLGWPANGKECKWIDIRDLALADLRARVGLVTQDVQLFGASVRDNIALFDPQISDRQIEGALGELGLLDWVSAMPQGLATPLAAGGGGMSAGEAQLLAFTRVLLRDPGLIILDEAASRLDPVTERRLEGAIDRLLAMSGQDAGPPIPGGGKGRQTRTAIIIAHRLSTVQRADDILILEEGRAVEFGPRAELAADPGSRFAALLRTGLEEALA